MILAQTLPATRLAREVALLSRVSLQSTATSPADSVPLKTAVENTTIEQVKEAPKPVSTAVQISEPTNMSEKSGTTYLEINLPDNSTPSTTPTSTLTEDQKKQRALIVGSVVLVLLVVMIYFFNRK